MDMNEFKEALKKAMREKGVSQKALSDATGVSQSSLSFFLNNGKSARKGLSGQAVLKIKPFIDGSLVIPSTPTPPEAQP